MIHLQNLTYTYPRQTEPALQNISLIVQKGEFVLVAGESGSGKTTLLRCLNGLVPHFTGGQIAGTIHLNGLDVILHGPTRLSREVGFVFQNPESQAILDEVEAEIALGMESAGIPPVEMHQRINELLHLLHISHLRHRSIRTLSGGERQKVALATVLALRPTVLLLDEPTSQLDPAAAHELLDQLVELNQKLGLTILLSEHRLERILPHVHRLLILQAGKLVTDAPVPEALPYLPSPPPLVALGLQQNWQPIPLTVADARQHPQIHSWQRSIPKLPQRTFPPLLVVENLSFGYAGKPLLQEVSLTVGAGEVVVLLGENGAGKTTLLKCLVGLLSLTSGTIQLAEQTIETWSVGERCRQIAYLPQNPDDLLFAETVLAELETTRQNHQKRKTNHLPIQEIAPVLPAALLNHLGLADVQNRYPRDLSVGQRQRVAFGAVAVMGPRLLLLDEPTRGLDMAAKQQLVNLCRWWLEDGSGLLLVTHDVELCAGIADRVLILKAGKLIANGSPTDILPQFPAFTPQLLQLLKENTCPD